MADTTMIDKLIQGLQEWTFRTFADIALSGFILITAFYGFSRLPLCAELPFSVNDTDDGLMVGSTNASFPFPAGSIIKKLDGESIGGAYHLSFVLERRSPSETVVIEAAIGGQRVEGSCSLSRFYSDRYLAITALTTLCVWLIGVFVRIRKQESRAARMVFFSMMMLTLVFGLATEQPFVGSQPWFVFAMRAIYLCGYAALPSFFILFLASFPSEVSRLSPWVLSVLLLPAAAISIFLLWRQADVCFANSLEAHRSYLRQLYWLYLYITTCLAGGIGLLVWRYRELDTTDERRQMRWVVWGIVLGSAPYLLFRALPQALSLDPLIPEELANVVVILVPASFVIAIVKERMLDIDVVINRTIVYAFLSAAIMLVYVALAGSAATLLGKVASLQEITFSAVLAIIIAFLLAPIKKRLQELVDKVFFRVKYNYQRASLHISATMSHALSRDELAEAFLQSLCHYLQLKGAVIMMKRDGSALESWKRGEVALLPGEEDGLLTLAEESGQPVGVRSTTEATRAITCVDALGVSGAVQLLLPLLDKEKECAGAVGIGRKLSDQRFLLEEIEFAGSVTEMAAVALQRLWLQEQVIAEQLEKQRLEKEKRELELLQKMRQDLGSMIVHDLRTPLASLLLSIQAMQRSLKDRITDKERKYFAYSLESGQKLIDMINDLLELHKMEEGQLKLMRQKVEMKEIVEDAMRQIEMLAKEKELTVEKVAPKECPPLYVDKEKITRVVVNLLSNAIKFSDKNSQITLQAGTSGPAKILLSVKDQGPGIPPEYVNRVFDKFVQVESRQEGRRFSTGLGLTYCKLAVENHGGKIWVESELGKGSTFFVELPAIPVG